MIPDTIIEAITAEKISGFSKSDEFFSKTRDVFTARIQSYILEEKKYLEAAVIGEIGNNTFDHNLVFDKKYPWGAYCNLAYEQKYIVLADYGIGVKRSLSNVISSTCSDLEAVEIAFTKKISGRSPEQRGNGLKFVTEAIRQNSWHLYFQSGFGACLIDRYGAQFMPRMTSLTGCLVIIDFNGDK